MGKNDYIDTAIEAIGGPEQIARDLTDFSRRCDIMAAHRREWTAKHPCKWVALTDDDELTVGDDLDDLTRKLVEGNKRRNNAVIKYLDPNPPIMIV